MGLAVSDEPRLVTARIVQRVEELLSKDMHVRRIANRIGCTVAATELIVKGKIGVGDIIPPDMKMRHVPITRCTECGGRVNQLPDGEMPCYGCRVRDNM